MTGASTTAPSRHVGWGGLGLAAWLGLVLLPVPVSAAGICDWREPPRIYAEGTRWDCTAVGWPDGDTLWARCEGHAEAVKVRLRGVDTDERGQGRWEREGRSFHGHRDHAGGVDASRPIPRRPAFNHDPVRSG